MLYQKVASSASVAKAPLVVGLRWGGVLLSTWSGADYVRCALSTTKKTLQVDACDTAPGTLVRMLSSVHITTAHVVAAVSLISACVYRFRCKETVDIYETVA